MAFYVGNVEPADIRRGVKTELPVYMSPGRIVRVREIPLNKNGKLNREYFRNLDQGGTGHEKRIIRILRGNVPDAGLYLRVQIVSGLDDQNLRDSFGKDVGLCYAMKANPFLADRAEKEADRIEICSMGEFQICREKRIEPKKMLISG